jgi:nitroimidazol reductase NimA-like FMN-containing flavoprotein (pyridoxamine 5'-phosphate oxidase superfamily)
MFSGRVTLLEDRDEKRKAISLMINQLDEDPETLIANLKPESLKNTVMGRIDIDYMTGKKSEEIEV